MAMTARTFKYVGSATPAANTVAGILDALYTLGTSATYYDASARTPGSGVAGTWTQHQVGGVTECLDVNPVSNSHAVRFLLAGSASARTPTMVTSPYTDSWQTATVLIGIARNWNSYNGTGNGWDQTLPGGVGSSFTGYVRAFATASLTATKVHLLECADGFLGIIAQSAGATFFGMGLEVDPRVTYATSPLAAENTSGGRYMMWNTSSSTAVSSVFNSATGTNVPFSTSGANSGHCYILSVGGVSLTAVNKDGALTNSTSTTSFVNADGDWMPREIEIVDSGNVAYGRLREIRIGPDRKIGDTFSSSGTVRGYCVSSHPSSDQDSLWVMA